MTTQKDLVWGLLGGRPRIIEYKSFYYGLFAGLALASIPMMFFSWWFTLIPIALGIFAQIFWKLCPLDRKQ